MAETKRNMIKRLSKPENPKTAMVLAHGLYASREAFSVPNGLIIIFVSRTARYLPSSVVNTEFYNVFTSSERIHGILSNPNSRPPVFLKDWEKRVYGPGDQCPNLGLTFHELSTTEPVVWGWGIHSLPLVNNQLKMSKGVFYGMKMKLSQVISSINGNGIIFVTSCRGTTDLPTYYQNVSANYTFPEWSLEYKLQRQNEISSRMLKRRRINKENLLRKNKNNTPDAKRRRINNRMNVN